MNIKFAPHGKGVIASLGSVFGGRKNEDNGRPVIDIDDKGEELYKEDIIAKVLEDCEKRKGDRASYEQQWILNGNFLLGNQFCDINSNTGEVEQQDAPYDWLEMRTFNQIAPLIETRVANLKKISYKMKVKPRTNELDDYAKAEVSTDILAYVQDVSGFKAKNDTAIHWNEVCGNCFYLSWWDASKGEKVAEKVTIEVDENGVEKKSVEAFYQGDVDYGILTPYEVLPENLSKQGIENQRSIIIEQIMHVKDIKDLYDIDVEGRELPSFELTPIASGGGFGYQNTVMAMGRRTVSDSERVVTYFERPSKHLPEGRMIIVVGEENLVYYGALPYGEIPIKQMVCREVAGQFYGKSVIEELIPYQKEYNSCKNRLHEFIKRATIGNILVEEGSVDIEELEDCGLEPGRILVYAQGQKPPTSMENGHLPSEIITEMMNLRSDMEYIAGTSQLMVTGGLPSGVTSGTAIENLRDIDNTRLSLTGDHIRDAVKDLGQLILRIYKLYANTPRIVSYTGSNNIAKAITWTKEDIESTDVIFTTENELLESEELQKQKFFEAFNLGLFTDDEGRIPARVKAKGIEYMKLGTYSELLSMDEMQLQYAQRENAFFKEGVIPEISEFDDHEIHFEEHERYLLQMDYHMTKMKKPEMAKAFEDHMRQHKQAIAEEKVKEQLMYQQIAQQMQGGM